MSRASNLETQNQVAEALHDSALIQASTNKMFCVYPIDDPRPELEHLKVSARWPRYSRVRGRPFTIPVEELDFFALLIDQRYSQLPEVIRKSDTIDQMASLMEGGNHVAQGNTHGELFDVPADLLGTSGRLRERNIRHRTALVASKGIDYMGIIVDAIGGGRWRHCEMDDVARCQDFARWHNTR